MKSEQDVIDIILGDDDDFVCVVLDRISTQTRWNTFYEKIVRHIPTGKLYEVNWSRGSTEMQDNGIENVSMYEVEPRETITIVYDRKEIVKINEKV